MLTLVILTWILTIGYGVLMLVYARGWRSTKERFVPANQVPTTKITVIIPARDEEKNIGSCLSSILSNDYPSELLEVIVIDDHSTDRTFEIAAGAGENVKAFRLSELLKPEETLTAYKKKALEKAISFAVGELIVTTDADCIVRPTWLRQIAAVFEKDKPVMIAGPVAFNNDGRIVSIFQSLDFMSMQGITAAANTLGLGNMSNGANLAFSKAAFHEVGGYRGIDHLASGDDFLLMMKMAKAYPGRISYLKSQDAIVHTEPQPDWTSFLNQRIRWASKSGKYDDKKLTAILGLVYVYNLMFLVLFILGFGEPLFFNLLIGFLLVKTSVELYFLVPVAGFYKKERELLWFPLLQPLHILYIIVAGLLGFVGVYQWKGRRVR